MMQIGEYTIVDLSDDSLWIEKEDGEGFGYSKEKFEELLKEFFKENM